MNTLGTGSCQGKNQTGAGDKKGSLLKGKGRNLLPWTKKSSLSFQKGSAKVIRRWEMETGSYFGALQ